MNRIILKNSNDFRQKTEAVFKKEKIRLKNLLGDLDIQHIGATSVPGLLTKGDVDLNIRVDEKDFIAVVEKLKKIYKVNQEENWKDNFASFKDEDTYELPLGIQLTVKNTDHDFFIKIRDSLNDNPGLVEEFNNLKSNSLDKTIEEYRDAKSDFIWRKILNK